MRKALILAFFLAFFVQVVTTSIANAKGPYGNIHVGQWKGGALTDDNTGAFSHCSASSIYGNGVILVVGLNSQNSWLLGFASPSFHLTKGDTVPVDVTFDGQSQAKLFATANSDIMATAVLPPNVARTFQKSSLMVVTTGNSSALQFNLTSIAPLLATIANCVSTVKAGGITVIAPASSVRRPRRKRRRAEQCEIGQACWPHRHRLRHQCQRLHHHQSSCDRWLHRLHQGQSHGRRRGHAARGQ